MCRYTVYCDPLVTSWTIDYSKLYTNNDTIVFLQLTISYLCLFSVSMLHSAINFRIHIKDISPTGGSRERSISICLSQVGLVSSRLHGTFTAVPSQSAAGTLALVRRCQPVTCEGHCTCAPHGQLTCASTGGCVDVKGDMTSWHVTL